MENQSRTAALVLLFFLGTFQICCTCRQPRVQLPEIELEGMEPPVVAKIDSLRRAVRLQPENAAAWGRLGMTLYAHDMKEAAMISLQHAAFMDSSDFRWPYLVGYIAASIAPRRALPWLEHSLRVNPRYAPAYIRYGEALFLSGALDRAEAAFRHAVTIDRSLSHAWLGLARVAFARNAYTQSLAFLHTALSINPQHGEVYGLMATVYRRMGRRQQAAEALLRARELPAQTLLREPVVSQALHEGASSYWHLARGRELFAQARYYAALDEFHKALEYQKTAEVYYQIGRAYLALQEDTRARQSFQAALALQPGHPGASQAIAHLARRKATLDSVPHDTALVDPGKRDDNPQKARKRED